MNARSGGLGRGLGELFQRTDAEERSPQAEATNRRSEPLGDGSWYQEIPVESISPNPRQPRSSFDDDALEELSASIGDVGLLQPIVVRNVGNDHYELIMGERRWRATQRAGLAAIPAIVRATEDDQLLTDALLENLHRSQLNPLEEAAAYQQLMDDFGCTQEELAKRVKKSRPHVSNTVRLLKLPAPVQRRVAAGVLSAGHARALLALDDPAAQEHLAQRIVAEGVSVRGAEELVALGQRDETRRRAARPQSQPNPRADEVAGELSDRFDTRVKVALGKHRGRITIEFAGEEDLDRILALVAPGQELIPR